MINSASNTQGTQTLDLLASLEVTETTGRALGTQTHMPDYIKQQNLT